MGVILNGLRKSEPKKLYKVFFFQKKMDYESLDR